MADKISARRRSQNMAAIRSKDTEPELAVRGLVHGLGYRYRLHRPDLPGKPDLVFGRLRAVIFVHGCFWHLHSQKGCVDSRKPKSNMAYWHQKLLRNTKRDKKHKAALRKLGWRVLVIWDCETKSSTFLTNRITQFLERS